MIHPAPRRVAHDAFTAIGIEIRTDNTREADPAHARIPGLWQRFFQEGIAEKIPGRTTDAAVLGIYTDYAHDHTAPYTLIVGTQTADAPPAPQDMRAVRVPAGDYLVFVAEGPMPQALIDTWARIWSYFADAAAPARAYAADFERHAQPQYVEVHIGVK